MKPFFLSIVFALSLFDVCASHLTIPDNSVEKKGVVQGVIESKNGGKPIEYASIILYSLPDSTLITGTVSGSDGSFRIGKLPQGTYFLVAYFMGFNKQVISKIEITGRNSVINCGRIVLEEATISLAGVEITQEKNPVEYQLDKKVINASTKMDSKGGSVVNLLENTPSIQVDIEGNVSLRGSTNYTVFVDGKPSSLSGSDVLKQIPANMVDKVEIITNPSAKYDPQGTAGIINVIMKKNYQNSTSALINTSIGTYNNYSGDFNLNHRTPKLNLFLNGNGAYNGSYPYNTMESDIFYTDSSRHTSQTEARKQRVTPYSFQTGFDWNISPKSTLSGEYSWGYWGMNIFIPTKTIETFSNHPDTNYNVTNSLLDIGGYYNNASLVYNINLDTTGQNLKTSFVFATWNGSNSNDVNDLATLSDFETTYYGIHHISERTDNTKAYQLKLDYTLPINSKYTLEMGYLGNFKHALSGYQMQSQDYDTQEWSIDPENDHQMKFFQNIQAIYGTFSAQWEKTQVMLGLRGEYYCRALEVIDVTDHFNAHQFNLFPTLHISRELKNNFQIQASYSRRVNRPREWNLFPYSIYSDKYIRQIGNPNLMPEFANSYEVNVMKQFKKGFLSLETFYRNTNNAFSQEMSIDSTGIILIEVENLNKVYAYGAELSGNFRLADWVNIYASANLYSYNLTQVIGSNMGTNRSINSDWALNTTFKFWKTFRVQVVGFYNSPKVTSQGSEAQMYGVNLSLGKDFFNKKLTINITARDLFNTAKYKVVTNTPQLQSIFIMNNNYPVILLNISYKINNYKRRAPIETDKEPVFEGGA